MRKFISQTLLSWLEQLVKILQPSDMQKLGNHAKPVPFNCFTRSRRIIILIILYNFKYSLEMSLVLIRNFKFGFILLSIHSISTSFHNCCEWCRHNLLWKSGVFLIPILIQMIQIWIIFTEAWCNLTEMVVKIHKLHR